MRYLLILLFSFFCSVEVFCQQITYEYVSGLTYDINLELTKSSCYDYNLSQVEIIVNSEHIILNAKDSIDKCNGTITYLYDTSYVFPGPGEYILKYDGSPRTCSVTNYTNAQTEPLSILTTLIIGTFTGPNHSPVFTSAINFADTMEQYYYNTGAVDPNNDSLFYQFWLLDTTPVYTIPTGFSINPVSGEIQGPAPTVGETYELSILIEEWKKVNEIFVKVGQISKSHFVISQDYNYVGEFLGTGSWFQNDSGYYEYNLPALKPFSISFIYEDTLADSVKTEALGEPFILNNPPSYSEFNNGQNATGLFSWTPMQQDIRSYPYTVFFRGTSYYDTVCVQKDLTLIMYVDYPTGIGSEITENASLKLYPNPTTGRFTVSSKEQGTFTLTDITGREIATGKLNEEFNIREKRSGIYFVKVGSQILKLVKD